MKKLIPVGMILFYIMAFLNVHSFIEWRFISINLMEFVNGAQLSTDPIAKGGAVGDPGDINMTFEAIHPFIKYHVGGHAGIVKDNQTCVETTGLDPVDNVVQYRPNNWYYRHDMVIGVSVDKASKATKAKSVLLAEETLGKPYDYSFMPYNQSYYCTEVVTYAWDRLNYSLNYDGFFITIQDVLLSPLTNIKYLQFVNHHGEKLVYKKVS